MSAEHYRRLERMYKSAPINQIYIPEIEIGDGVCAIRVPMKPQYHHAAGAVHGSVYFKLLDDTCFFAANSLVPEVFVLTVSFTVYLLRPIVGGTMHARAKVVNQSKRLIVAEGELFDDNGKSIGRGSGTLMPGTTALTPEIGYV